MAREARRWLRCIGYSRPLSGLTQLLQPRNGHEDQSYWDAALSGPMVDYLGDTRAVIESNGVILALLRIFAPRLLNVLDVGCAGGSLAYDLPPTTAYVGVDISAVAIADAMRRREHRVAARTAPTTFYRGSIVEYDPGDGGEYDAIVFSEVLYYLTPQTAREQVLRYSRALAENGIIVVSMKQDAKSSLIFRQLASRLAWLGGILHQSKRLIEFRTRPNDRSPPFLVGAFRASN